MNRLRWSKSKCGDGVVFNNDGVQVTVELGGWRTVGEIVIE